MFIYVRRCGEKCSQEAFSATKTPTIMARVHRQQLVVVVHFSNAQNNSAKSPLDHETRNMHIHFLHTSIRSVRECLEIFACMHREHDEDKRIQDWRRVGVIYTRLERSTHTLFGKDKCSRRKWAEFFFAAGRRLTFHFSLSIVFSKCWSELTEHPRAFWGCFNVFSFSEKNSLFICHLFKKKCCIWFSGMCFVKMSRSNNGVLRRHGSK